MIVFNNKIIISIMLAQFFSDFAESNVNIFCNFASQTFMQDKNVGKYKVFSGFLKCIIILVSLY